MWTFLLILIPLVSGLLCFTLKGRSSRPWALAASLLTLGIAVYTVWLVWSPGGSAGLSLSWPWIPQIHSRFSLGIGGLGAVLCLLNALAFTLVFLSSYPNKVEQPGRFFGLMLLSQAGMMGVFSATDALLFYSFWELALIPMYFLCSTWGGPRRVAVTFKFFLYTFVGSILMLVGIIVLYFRTPGSHSFALPDFIQAGNNLDPQTQGWLFWLFFGAFAVKMPVFPFHTWQPDTYEQSATPITLILSAVMVKMGLYGLIRWVLPVLPAGVSYWSDLAMILSVTGIVYASWIALAQKDLKRLIAWSSIAHMGLMSAVLFSGNPIGIQGVMIQLFNHGINIMGLWLIVDMLERRWGSHSIPEIHGIAGQTPRLATFLVLISLASIGLPLTNGFVGEFLMFTGLYQVSPWIMFFAGLAVILGAVYMLNMLKQVVFGKAESPAGIPSPGDLSLKEGLALALITLLILLLGVYPQPMFDLLNHHLSTIR